MKREFKKTRSDLPSFQNFASLRICSSLLFGIILFFAASTSYAVTAFSPGTNEKQIPAPFKFNNIWFYNQEKSKVIPDIDLTWITVVFRSGSDKNKSMFLKMAQDMVAQNDDITDLLYDHNLAKDACFFRLRHGFAKNDLKNLIEELNHVEFFSYAHPTIKLNNKTYAYFNAFEIKWKTGADPELKKRLMNQALVSPDKDENVYRVNLFQTDFFKAINLLAEDIHTLSIRPCLAELKPSVRAELLLAINGGNIGDKIPFSFNVTFSDFISIDPSSIANINLRPADIQKEFFEQKSDPYDYVEAASQNPIHITGWIKIFTPGEFVILPVKIKYTCSECSDTQVKTIETKHQPFKISSITPSEYSENKLIIPTELLTPDYRIEFSRKKANTNLVLSCFSFLAGFLCITWFVGKAYALKKQKQRLQLINKQDILAEKLRMFLSKTPSVPHWTYMAEASKILREYLAEKYHIPQYPEKGTGQVFFESVRQSLPETLSDIVRGLFRTVDDTVALELDIYPDIEAFKTEITKFL